MINASILWLLSHDWKFSLCQEFPMKRRREGQEVDTNSPTEGQRSAASEARARPQKTDRGETRPLGCTEVESCSTEFSPSHNCWPVWSPSITFLEWCTSRPHLHPVPGDPALRRGTCRVSWEPRDTFYFPSLFARLQNRGSTPDSK